MINPLNRHLVLEEIELKEEKQEDSLVLVPDDYKLQKQSLYGVYKVIAKAPDCERVGESLVGCRVVVDESMVQKIPLGEEKYYLILENYVYGSH